MKRKRIMLAAPGSGSGKTTITCALLRALKDRGQQVISYKCGPDYIDPMFHKAVLGVACKNLDTFFTGEKKTRELFLEDRTEEDFAVLEGVMGLFDGLGGICEEGSSYHLAKVTKTPIVLVVDAKGMGRSVIALVAGFLAYDTEKLVRGVIFNRMSKAYYEIIKPVAEQELGIWVLGYVPEHKERQLQSRHLGLVMPDELGDIREQIKASAGELSRTVSIEAITEIANSASELDGMAEEVYITKEDEDCSRPVIAVARDEAFCFYYADNLSLLEKCGAKLHYFSPIRDEKLPEGCCGILLGGGYPELYAALLSANISMRQSIKQAFEQSMPMVAECGGFMYLHSQIQDKAGVAYPMVGVLSGICKDMGKSVRFGYVEIREQESCFLPVGERIKGHEFHYFDSTENGNACIARKPASGKEYSCVTAGSHYWLGFPHLYYPSNPGFAEYFVKIARNYKNSKA